MNNHEGKEPPLQTQVNHKASVKTNILYYVSMTFFVIMLGFTFAGV